MSAIKAATVGIVGLFVLAAGLSYYGYEKSVYPIDRALGNLARAGSTQTPYELAEYIRAAKADLPKSGNPVWAFPTARTDFGLIQLELDRVLSRANSIASLEPHSSAYSTGMADIHVTLVAMQKDIIDTIPYMYVSTTNMAISAVWIAIILGLFTVMRRGKSRFQEFESQ
jgi:hypothetical protein